MGEETLSADGFFQHSDLTLQAATHIVTNGLRGAGYGEFYQETTASEFLAKDKGRYTGISCGDSTSGFGFRVGQDDRIGYVYSNIFNRESLSGAVSRAREVLKGHSGTQNLSFGKAAGNILPTGNPLAGADIEEKIKTINAIEAYAMSLDPNIENVTISYSAGLKNVHIITADGQSLVEQRPMAGLSLAITLKGPKGKIETGSANRGGRVHCKDVFNPAAWQGAAHEALALARMRLIAKPAPAGIMDVVLNHGWPAVLLHEAIGHGLEGDFNRRGISVYSGRIGEQIAAPGVTIVDQGNMPGERGSQGFDDEGIPTQENVLVENGVLKKYMQDRQNAALMNVSVTGNGRRQNYTHAPMPRMTNTYFRPGTYTPEEIIGSVEKGLYVSDLGGGQVNITKGRFNMRSTLAYEIVNGKISRPVKGATLIGIGEDVIKSIQMMGNDLVHEKAHGSCGKNDQTVAVSCGQPTLLVRGMTVGGTR